jgi:alpha-1,6-mannosyltransferase
MRPMEWSQGPDTSEQPGLDAASLRLRVNLLGCAALAGYAVLTVLSWVQAPALWRAEDATNVLAFFEALAARLPVLGLYHSFASSEAVILTYWGPLVPPTLATILLVLLLARPSTRADEALQRLIFNWSVAFAAVCLLAFPVFTQDMWLSAVWGRMISAGVNPYYELFTADSLTGLPLDHFPMVMSYGPLWGIISAIVMAVAGNSVLVAGILFKAVLATAWVGSLVLIERITRARPARERCLAVGMFGWAPASVSQSLAEGHNDIVLVAFAMLWMLLLLQARRAAPVALVASALCKYVTAPLLLIDAIVALRREGAGWRQYLARLLAPAVLGLGTLALFYRSPNFFEGVRVVSEWHFLRPIDALIAIEQATGLPLLVMHVAVVAFFMLHAAYWLAVSFWSPTVTTLQKAIIATMAAVLFAAVSHVWPWYAIWALAPAALVPGWWLSRFVFGVVLVMPFSLAIWWSEPFPDHMEFAALIVYAAACLWTIATASQARRS